MDNEDELESRLQKAQSVLRDALNHKSTMHFLPQPYDLPWATEVKLDDLDSMLAKASPHCPSRAQISQDVSTGPYAMDVPLFQIVICERPPSHDGPHLAEKQLGYGQIGPYFHLRKTHAWKWEQGAPSARSSG